jgi:predicted nucleotidyltransferase
VLRGDDEETSDLDILVDTLPGTTLFDLGGLQEHLRGLLGVQVDIRTPGDLPLTFRDEIVSQAEPV